MGTQIKKDQPLYGEILTTAHVLFRNKGFEETTIKEICEPLNISISQFGLFFESLDEVLETLWAK
jgi:AcrR family transcriptional regulator